MGKGIRYFMKEREISGLGLLLWLLLAAAVALGCVGLLTLGSEESFPVYITEVLASNTMHPNSQGYCCDYIEIHNRSDRPVDLTGYQLGDIAGGSRYAFPAGTVLAPGEYLVIYCSRTVTESGYAAFEIARSGGEDYYLIAANRAVVDRVTTVATEPDQAMVRQADGQWQLSMLPTPGFGAEHAQPVQDIYNSGLSPVRITEFSPCGNGYNRQLGLFCDWIELCNTGTEPADISGFILSDNPGNDKYRIPPGTVLEPGAYLVVYCQEQADDPTLAAFGLSQTLQETLVLKDAAGRIIELVTGDPVSRGAVTLGTDGLWVPTEQPSPGFANTPAGHMAYLEQLGAAPGAIRISEVMSARQLVLPDGQGEFQDWVELYNPGPTAVNLTDWGLTDDPAQPGKWRFPAVTLEPGAYLLIFCSGQDRTEAGEFHCSFSLSAAGETLTLTSPLGTVVDAVTFGQGQTNQSFCFAAGEVLLTDTPTPGYANDARGYAQFCDANQPVGPLAIWEVMTSNNRYLPQQLGKCYDWVEVRNVSGEAVQLSDFTLTDDPDHPELYRLPEKLLQPGEMAVIILSGDTNISTSRYAHAGFSLDAAEDQLLLYGPGQRLLDYVYLKEIPREQSYGRGEAGGFCYMTPTPLGENASGVRQISAMPTASHPAGVYTGDAFTVTLEAPGSIHYTTDGSVPDASSAEYNGPLEIRDTTVLRAVALEADKLPSDIYTATFVTAQHELPVVSLVTDPDGLWGPNGVYKNGDITVKEVRLASHVAYSGTDGSFALDCEMSLHGATTVVAFDKKSFTLRFRDAYDGPLEYDVFEDGEVTQFSSLLLRTSHESTYSSQMHDVLMADAADRAGAQVSYQKYKYAALYLNGKYWGLYALREHHAPEHYGSYWEVPAEDVTMVRFMTDEVNSLSAFYTFCSRNSLATAENYAYAKSVLDLQSYADWMIFQAYVCNVDIYENMRYYYSPADGLWRCGLSDMDLGMCGSHKAFDEVAETFHHGRVAKALMQNEEFRQLLATRLAELLAGPLSDEAMVQAIDRIAAQIRPEAENEAARWGTPVWGWENAVDYMKNFCSGRSKEMIDSLCAQLGATQAQREAWFGEVE